MLRHTGAKDQGLVTFIWPTRDGEDLNAALQLQLTKGRYALATMCIGVGQGIALIVEKV